jgi:hypothetical protein
VESPIITFDLYHAFFFPGFTAILVGVASGTTLTVSKPRFRMFPLCVFV